MSEDPTRACIDDDLASRFVRRSVDAPSAAFVRTHMAACAPCRRLISELIKRTTQPLPAVPRPR
jgi:hypothetical protein